MLPPLVLCLLALAACDRGGSADAPAADAEARRGLYTLRATGAGPVPALLGEAIGCRYTAAAGHVALLSRARYEAMLVRVRECDAGAAPDTTFMDQGLGSFTTKGDTLRFQLATGGTSGVGAFHGDTLTVQGTGQTMHYVRDAELSEQLIRTDTAK